MTHTFSYERSANSSLGVGISANGAYGSFSASGTSSGSSTSLSTYDTFGDNVGIYYETTFNSARFKFVRDIGAGIICTTRLWA